MQEHEITTPDDLDVSLAGSTLSKRQKLWKAASGHSPRRTDVGGRVGCGHRRPARDIASLIVRWLRFVESLA